MAKEQNRTIGLHAAVSCIFYCGHETQKRTPTAITGVSPPPRGFENLYDRYPYGWTGYYESPRVYQYEVYTSETSLYETAKNELVWSGTAETRSPSDLNAGIRNYVEIMISALKERKLI